MFSPSANAHRMDQPGSKRGYAGRDEWVKVPEAGNLAYVEPVVGPSAEEREEYREIREDIRDLRSNIASEWCMRWHRRTHE